MLSNISSHPRVRRSEERRVGKDSMTRMRRAEDGIRDDLVTGVQTVLFRSHHHTTTRGFPETVNWNLKGPKNIKLFLFRYIATRESRNMHPQMTNIQASAQDAFEHIFASAGAQIGRASCRER